MDTKVTIMSLWPEYEILQQTRLHELITDGRFEGVLILLDPLIHVEYS